MITEAYVNNATLHEVEYTRNQEEVRYRFECAKDSMDENYKLNRLYWQPWNSNKILIGQMTSRHIRNCIKYLKKRPFWMSSVWIDIFKLELKKRV